jgi:hypothetical protein
MEYFREVNIQYEDEAKVLKYWRPTRIGRGPQAVAFRDLPRPPVGHDVMPFSNSVSKLPIFGLYRPHISVPLPGSFIGRIPRFSIYEVRAKSNSPRS